MNSYNDSLCFEKLYAELEGEKYPYIYKAKECADFTIPSAFPDFDGDNIDEIVLPYSSLGGRGVSNLAAKLMSSLFPINTPFFELEAENENALIDLRIQNILAQIEADVGQIDIDKIGDVAKDDIKRWFNSMELLIGKQIETKRMRSVLQKTLIQLIIAGNCLLVFTENARLKMYKLHNYVVRRDLITGEPIFIAIKEEFCIDELDEDMKERIEPLLENKRSFYNKNDKQYEEMYTAVERRGSKYYWNVEVNKNKVFEEDVVYDKNPFLALRFTSSEGNYSFSFVHEQALGDLKNLNKTIKDEMEIIRAAARLLFLIDPFSGNSAEDLAKAKNGDFVSGKADGVQALQIDKRADLSTITNKIETLKRELQLQFLMTQGVQRSGERVTAFEISQLAQELDISIGGIYSDMVEELQQPLLNLISEYLTAQDIVPDLKALKVEPIVTAGLAGIGRSIDLSNLVQWLSGQPEPALQYVDWGVYARRSASLAGIKLDSLIKSQQQVDAERMAAMEQQAALNAAAPVASNLTKGDS